MYIDINIDMDIDIKFIQVSDSGILGGQASIQFLTGLLPLGLVLDAEGLEVEGFEGCVNFSPLGF